MMRGDGEDVISTAALAVGVMGALAIMFSPLTPWPSHILVFGGTAAATAITIILVELFRWSNGHDKKHHHMR